MPDFNKISPRGRGRGIETKSLPTSLYEREEKIQITDFVEMIIYDKAR